MSSALESKLLETEIYRVGRPPDPWAWIDWAYAGPDGTFGHRWDDAYGRYRVLYACSQRVGAFLETLAPFRPDPEIMAELETMDILEGDDDTTAPGVVPLTWCRERMITKGIATEIRGSFVAVGAAITISTLRRDLAARVVHFGLPDLDAAAIRLSAPRAFTQEISSYVEARRDENGQAYAGIYYLSKLGDDIENWAIFEQQSMSGQSPVLSVERETVDPDDDDLREALKELELVLAD